MSELNRYLLIAISGEISIKGKQTRRNMIKILIRNLKAYCMKFAEDRKLSSFSVDIVNRWDHLLLKTAAQEHLEALAHYLTLHVSGISWIAPVIHTTSDLKDIEASALNYFMKTFDWERKRTFAVRVQRHGRHPYKSIDVARGIGAIILSNLPKNRQLKVNLTTPDYELHIYIKNQVSYIFSQKLNGYGGLPVGCQGSVVAALRPCKDDLINSFLFEKRGAKVKPIYFYFDETFKENDVFYKAYIHHVTKKTHYPLTAINLKAFLDEFLPHFQQHILVAVQYFIDCVLITYAKRMNIVMVSSALNPQHPNIQLYAYLRYLKEYLHPKTQRIEFPLIHVNPILALDVNALRSPYHSLNTKNDDFCATAANDKLEFSVDGLNLLQKQQHLIDQYINQISPK